MSTNILAPTFDAKALKLDAEKGIGMDLGWDDNTRIQVTEDMDLLVNGLIVALTDDQRQRLQSFLVPSF